MIIIFTYIIRITCIFKMTVILTYSPPMITDDVYYRTIFSDLFASDKMYRRREASACLSTKQDRRWYHFNALGITPDRRQSRTNSHFQKNRQRLPNKAFSIAKTAIGELK